jgi:hypothetical protein
MDFYVAEAKKTAVVASRLVAMAASAPTLIAAADPNRIHIVVESDAAIRFGGADVSLSNGYLVPATGYTPFTLPGAAARAALYGFAVGGTDSVRVFEVIEIQP